MAVLASGCTSVSPTETSTLTTPQTYTDITLSAPDGREIPTRVFMPTEDCSPCELIIFSHGNLATYDRYDVLLEDWAARGYVVASSQHIDSEEHPERERYANDDVTGTRLEDYIAASEYFAEPGLDFEGLSFSENQFAAGHSYGGMIALIAGGAVASEGALDFSDAGVEPSAIVAISPPGELPGRIDNAGYALVDKPLLVVTGTTDVLPGFIDEWDIHLDSFYANETDNAYALVFENMNHYFNGAFGRITPEGAAAQPAIDTLNTQISAFLGAISNGEPPSGSDWEQTNNPIARVLTK